MNTLNSTELMQARIAGKHNTLDAHTIEILEHNRTHVPASEAELLPLGNQATFTADTGAAMGVEPESAWPLIAQLYDVHGWSAWYDLGLICIVIVGVGVLYLQSIA